MAPRLIIGLGNPRRRIADLRLIVGLGNPGSEYADHRHNVGFWCIDRLAKRHGIKMKAGGSASTGRGRIGQHDVLLMKPRTFVNRSGEAVGPLLRREGIPIENVLVIYDELDLPEGRIRIRPRGGDGGHNGLKSIIAATGSGDFGRMRVGIGRPQVAGEPSWDPPVVAKHVLSRPSKASRAVLEAAVERACDAVEAVLAEGYEPAMNRFNAGDS